MITISREKGESVMIGDDVEVTILDVCGDKTQIGITSPQDIPVHKKEKYEEIQRKKAEETK